MSTQFPICTRCSKPVHRPDADVFEGMHWLCFHLEFEHEGDPDKICADPSCPWWHIEVFRSELTRLGSDPETVMTRAIRKRWNL